MSVGSTVKNYPGSIDTFITWEDDVDTIIATAVNDAYSQILAIESELGTDPAGSLTDVKTRLAISINDDGTIKNGSVPDGALVSTYVKADGTTALTGDWNVGGSNNINNISAVGIGSTNPQSALHVVSSAAPAAIVRQAGNINNELRMKASTNYVSRITFYENNIYRARIQHYHFQQTIGIGSTTANAIDIDYANGRVGIGKTNPSVELEVVGTAKFGIVQDLNVVGGTAAFTSSGNNEFELKCAINYANRIRFYENSVYRARIQHYHFQQTIGIGSTTVDTLNIDYANGRVGIGKTNPSFVFQVVGGADIDLLDSLNVIGSTSPLVTFRTTGAQNNFLDMNATTNYVNRIRFYENSVYVSHIQQYQFQSRIGIGSTTVDTLNVDYANGRVGIGKTNPTDMLSVEGNVVGKSDSTSNLGSSARRWAAIYMASTIDYSADLAFSSSGEKIRFTTGGNVGIGTTNPAGKLEVRSDSLHTRFIDPISNRGIGTPIIYIQTPNDTVSSNAIGMFGIGDNTDSSNLGNLFRVTQTGNVGIGTTDPSDLLSVEGQISLTQSGDRKFKVDTSGQIYSDAGTTITTPADLAEWTKVKGDLKNYEVGTLVMQSDEDLTVDVAKNGGFEIVYGAVTDRAAFLGGLTGVDKKELKDLTDKEIEKKYNAKKIAIVGHVRVKVIGSIKKGQLLTISKINGVAKKVSTFEETCLSFGIARQDYNSDEKIGLIEVRLK